MKFIELLFENFKKNMEKYIEIRKNDDSCYCSENYMNKNHGKTVLKRKITTLRQELLNLEKMLG